MDILAIIGIIAAIIGITAAIVQVLGKKLKSPSQNCCAIPGRRQMGRARFNVSTGCLCTVRSAPQMVCAAQDAGHGVAVVGGMA